MKKPPATAFVALGALTLGLFVPATHAALTDSLKAGKLEFKSMNQLAFGPEGILFVADAKSAAIVALATGDTKPATTTAPVKALAVNETISALTGTKAEDIIIEDLAVNPISRQAYLAVTRGRGPHAVSLLVRTKADGQPELVSLDNMKFARAELTDAPADGSIGEGRRATRATSRSPTSSSPTAACSSPVFPTKNFPPRSV
ncbi:MAG: hypothetical protein H7343_04760 [Undibacterium sp.]|nr:hypothetical protein [Opitutaceae bacterium]